MEIELVKVKESEIPVLAALADEIWHECFTDILTSGQIDYMVDKFQSPSAFKEYFADKNYRYLFITYCGEIAGYTGFKIEKGKLKLFLSKLYVKGEFRRRGIAGECIAKLAEFCRKNNLSEIYLTVNRRNKRAISAYVKNGFEITSEQKTDIGCGYVMDDYVMMKKVAC